MHINFLAVLIAAIIPIAIGAVWYNPKVFGTAWMSAAGVPPNAEQKKGHMASVFIISFILSFILAFGLQFMVIHQFHVTSLFFKLPINDPATSEGALYQAVMNLLGTSYRTFKHGALHGVIGGIMMSIPILGINALFEGKGFKYIAINCGYWIVCMGIMGGIISAFA